MIRGLHLLFLLALSILVVSCFKEDTKITPHQPGTARVDTIDLTNLYTNQVYYNLAVGQPSSVNLRKLWDLSFGSAVEDWHIRLNTSCFMVACMLPSGQFGMPADTTGVVWSFDNSNGAVDSTAIGQWFKLEEKDTVSNGNLIIINRGLDEAGNERGLFQLMIDSLANNTFYFRVADFNGGNPQAHAVSRDPLLNHVLFSYKNETANFQEPIADSWDLLFSQYTTLLYTDLGEPYPYLVTGVLLNPAKVEVAQDIINTFENITFESAKTLSYSTQQDFIGYDWKYYNFDTGVYTVRFDKIYIIHAASGYYFKLRFLGFYNRLGEKGFPSIEYQQL
jgi:hypothetical protein